MTDRIIDVEERDASHHEDEKPSPVSAFVANDGFVWESIPHRAGFRTEEGRQAFLKLYPNWETYVV